MAFCIRAWIGFALLTLSPAAASAQAELEAADHAYAEGRLDQAARGYEDALGTSRIDPAGLVRAHLRLGVLNALAGDIERADRHFAIALALDPVRDAPEELGPELRARFEAMRATRDGRRLRASIEDVEGALRITVHDAPGDLARTLLVRGGTWERRMPWEGEPLRLEPPPDARPVEVLVLDAYGNRLARAGARPAVVPSPQEVAVLASEPATSPTGESEPNGRSIIETPWLWVVVGIIVLGIGVTVGVSASGDRYVLDPPVIR